MSFYAFVDKQIRKQIKQTNLPRAQYMLDTQLMSDMLPYMPYDTMTLRNMTLQHSTAVAGTGKVCVYTTPYGHYQWEGVSRFSGNPLHYWKNPNAKPHWDEVAIAEHYDEYVEMVTRILTNGK